jgi:hypothetical protein
VAAFLILAAALAGCGGEREITPVPVGEMVQYRDPALGYAISHPKDWVSVAEVGRARFFNAPEVEKRFLDPTGPYPDGVLIAIDVTKPQETTPLAEKARLMKEMSEIGFVLAKEDTITLAGVQAMRVPYTANYTPQIQERGQHIYVVTDTVLYDIKLAGFGDLYQAHAGVFAAALKSFELPRPKEKGLDETLPSVTMTPYETPFLSFQYPDNYNFVSVPKGSNDLVVALRGVRQDCSIRFDVFPAKGLTAAKVADQNMGGKTISGRGQTTIGGQPASFFTYVAAKDVERRFYFAVKNDKVIRVTLDWFRPQRDAYLATYEAVIKSIVLK